MDSIPHLPLDINRFIATSIDSVPHLEAILLLRYDPSAEWTSRMMAERLFLADKRAEEILLDLAAAGFCTITQEEPLTFRYSPISKKLRQMVDLLPAAYAQHMVEIHNLIHSKINKQAQQFGDAFKFKKDE